MKYIIARDEYVSPGFHNGPLKLYSFTGTRRELLEHLTGFADWKDEPDYDKTDEGLEKLFNDSNGDGCDYVEVFNVDEDKMEFQS